MCCVRIYQHCNLLVGGGGRFRSSKPRPLLSTVCFQPSPPCSLCNTSLPQHAVVCRRRRSQPGDSSDCSRGATGVLCPHGQVSWCFFFSDPGNTATLLVWQSVCLDTLHVHHVNHFFFVIVWAVFVFLLLCWHIKDTVKFLCGNIMLN